MKKTLNINGKIVNLSAPLIMAIINLTPDSFYKDSRYTVLDENFSNKAKKLIENGANILDIGGYSTRPGHAFVSEDEEIARVIPAIKAIRNFDQEILISIDTFRSSVAKIAIEAGANIINDISGGDFDSKMHEIVKYLNVPYIIMHLKNNIESFHKDFEYHDFLYDIQIDLLQKAKKINALGIKDVIIDVGFGFSKDLDQNYELLKNLELFENFDYPLLIGLSRKSMIYKYLDIKAEETETASNQLGLIALLKNASIIRIHDVTSHKNTLKLLEKLK